MTDHILYNPLAGNGSAKENAEMLCVTCKNKTDLHNITEIKDYREFFASIEKNDRIIICGGDGTLNRFVNDTVEISYDQAVFYCPSGNGNDLARDLGYTENESPLCITNHIKSLPKVTVNGKTYRFINNVGYGIDGYCCEVGDELKRNGKKVNYTSVAIKGLLFHFTPCGANVTIDGKKYRYEKVWLAPTMKGRFYGGGMMPTPFQERSSATHELSLMIMHGANKLKTLRIFPSIFKGMHIRHPKHVVIHKGHQITVTFDRPCSIQIDGETITNVFTYTAFS